MTDFYPKPPKPTPADRLKWAMECIRNGRGLTDWERQFVGDMAKLLARGVPLSEERAKKLEQVYAEKTPL